MGNSYLIDTNIIIDALYHEPKATLFIESLNVINISVVTYFELIYGCKNKRDLKNMLKLLQTYNVEQINEKISTIAARLVEEMFLNSGVTMDDALIGATCLDKGYSLVTRDKRHFTDIKRLKIVVV